MNESGLKRQCVNAIKKINLPNFWFYCPADRFHSGIPDIIFCARGQFGAVELKAARGKVKPIQAFTHERIRSAGGRVAVIRDVDEFLEFIGSFQKKEG